MYKFALLLILLTFFSCAQFSNKGSDKILARVHEEYLYSSELQQVIPDNLSSKDSVLLAEDFINKWVRKQLLLFKAGINLTEEEKEVERQIEEYRASLLIFKYEQKYINQSLDTTVSVEDMRTYYEKYGDNFILDKNLIKGLLVKIPNNTPAIRTFRQNLRYNRSRKADEIDLYCKKYATYFNDFDGNWIDFSILAQTLPKDINNVENYIRLRKFDEASDSSSHYFLCIDDFNLANNIAPFEYVMEDIRAIIINKRKVKLINELEANIYNEGLNHSYFNVY